MFNELFESVKKVDGIMEAFEMSKEYKDQITKEMASPEILPCPFDVTLSGWYERIKLWGKVNIKYYEPGKSSPEIVNINFVRNVMFNEDLNNLFGQFKVERLDFHKMKFYRKSVSLDGKKGEEKFEFEIDLRKEIKDALKKGFYLW